MGPFAVFHELELLFVLVEELLLLTRPSEVVVVVLPFGFVIIGTKSEKLLFLIGVVTEVVFLLSSGSVITGTNLD